MYIFHGEVLAPQLTLQHIEFVMGVDGEKAQLPDQLHRTLLGTEQEVIQIVVQVVIDLQAAPGHSGV